MAFCANCGKQLKTGARFCPSCGKEIKDRPKEPASDKPKGPAKILAEWPTDRIDNELHGKIGEGIIKITEDGLVYHETKRKNKEDIIIPFSKITSVVKVPLYKMVSIDYNLKKGQGALKRIFGRKILALKFKGAKEFTVKVNERIKKR